MTKQKRIEGLLLELEQGYCPKLVSEINSLRIDIKHEREKNKTRPKIHQENIVIL